MCGWLYSVMVMWVVFILVGSRHLWGLLVEGGVLVGDGGAMVIVFLITLACGHSVC